MFEPEAGQRACPSCGLPINADADVCPYCAYDLPQQKSSLKMAALLFALLMLWPLIELIRYLVR